jgi:pimeloyl-ACP methyl ester carboxylesterase
MFRSVITIFLSLWMAATCAQVPSGIVDLATRPGVSQRLLILAPAAPKAVVLLFAGGHGGLALGSDGTMGWGGGNFLIRSRQLFVDQGLLTVIVDAPSDRANLAGFRQTAEHAEDIRTVIAWLRQRSPLPVWLVGTSRGTQSVAYLATALHGRDGPNGIVLTSTVLVDPKSRAVLAMPLERIDVPVLVVHHELDDCRVCSFTDLPALLPALRNAPRKELATYRGGISQGDPCEAKAYHGYNGIEVEVVARIGQWILSN